MTLLNEVPEDSRVVHYHMTLEPFTTATANRSTVLPCSALRSSVSPACGIHTLFAVNLCGRGQFAIDLLAHLGFKRMVSCSFRDMPMRLKPAPMVYILLWWYVCHPRAAIYTLYAVRDIFRRPDEETSQWRSQGGLGVLEPPHWLQVQYIYM